MCRTYDHQSEQNTFYILPSIPYIWLHIPIAYIHATTTTTPPDILSAIYYEGM